MKRRLMYNIGKLKKFIKRRLLAISLICTLCFSSCGTDKVVETEAEKIAASLISSNPKSQSNNDVLSHYLGGN